jgi:hypothetical protein
VKRLRIWIDHEIDAKLERRARETGRSKATLIREALRRELVLPALEEDPLWKMVGAVSFDPVPPEKIDDVVYGQPEA